jgi:HD-GYP domain-containing protein (c-di-GMP phosphodiesterase class II)
MAVRGTFMDAANTLNQYIAIDKHELIDALDLPVDVYVRLGGDRYICICKRGSKFTLESLHATQDSSLKLLYVTENDYPSLLKFNLNISRHLSKLPSIRPDQSLKIHSSTFSSLLRSMSEFGIDETSFVGSKDIAKSVLNSVQKRPDLHQLITKIEALGPLIVQKTMLTTILSANVAMIMGMSRERTELLVLSALLHDLGLKEIPSYILDKARIDLTAEERSTFETHPFRGAELIRSYVQKAPEELIQVVLQHHELGNGLGFPQKLDHLKIHPFSRIVAASDWIADSLIGFSTQGKKMSYAQVITALETLNIPINRQVYTILKTLSKK